MASFDICEVVQQISGAALAHNGSQVPWQSFGGRLWSCAELGQLFSTFQCPPHSGTGQPWFSSQPHGKVINGGVGNTNVPSSNSGPALGEACGKMALWLLCSSRRTLQLGQGHAYNECLIHHHLRET